MALLLEDIKLTSLVSRKEISTPMAAEALDFSHKAALHFEKRQNSVMINPSQKHKIEELKTPQSNFDNENKFQHTRSSFADHLPTGHLMMKKAESFKH